MNMEKSTFSFKINEKRHSTKITEEKNPRSLINYLKEEEENLQEWIEKWLKKAEEQRWNLKRNWEWMKERLYGKENKLENPEKLPEKKGENINFLMMKEEEIP